MEKLKEFHQKANLAVNAPFSKELLEFRMKLIYEEVQELADAALRLEGDLDQGEQYVMLQDFLQEMCDVVYVIKGTALSFGMDFDKAFDLVHQANMSKFPVTKTKEGKVKKGKNYQPPVLEECV